MRQPEVVRCVEFVELVTEWLEDQLGDDERLALEEHLVICPHCTRYLHQLRLATDALREASDRLAGGAPPPAARQALLDAFRADRRASGG